MLVEVGLAEVATSLVSRRRNALLLIAPYGRWAKPTGPAGPVGRNDGRQMSAECDDARDPPSSILNETHVDNLFVFDVRL